MIKITNKHIKAKEPNIQSSRKFYVQKKTVPHEMKMKLVKVR
jgi:hypothetical protein